MIPDNINRVHIIKAIMEIEESGTPNGRRSRKFLLLHSGKYCSPKYVISLANRYANGIELDPSKFSGGQETNSFLARLGFRVVELPLSRESDKSSFIGRKRSERKKRSHNERCPECKKTIEAMLRTVYGEVAVDYGFETGTKPEDYADTPFYPKLKEIFRALQGHRGHYDFVKSKTLPRCDFFIPHPGFIVEFDESQHFSLPRKITLQYYPEKLELGFDIGRWMILCERIDAKDNDPPYRDEQRAWYDTLRDFLPAMKALKPTVRVFAEDSVWCSLNPNISSDVRKFESLLKRTSRNWEIEVREDPNPSLARVIIATEWHGKLEDARRVLEDICEKWPKGKKVKFVITCGGFIQFEWPKSMAKRDVGDTKYPNNKVVDFLAEEAKKCAQSVLSNGLNKKLAEFADYMTLGVDSFKERVSATQNYINHPHIELVFLCDLRNNKFYWTGKSYPTSNQQNGLVRISDLRTHFFDLEDVEKLMILGCHDLTVFNPRSMNATGWRAETNKRFKDLSKKEKPVYVLHHPHTTVKVRTWLNAWVGLRKTLLSVKHYAGAGRYFESDRKRSEWDRMDDVLKSTKCGSTIDFIVCP